MSFLLQIYLSKVTLDDGAKKFSLMQVYSCFCCQLGTDKVNANSAEALEVLKSHTWIKFTKQVLKLFLKYEVKKISYNNITE